MRIIVCPDSFKECLSSVEVAEYICAGLSKSPLSAKIHKLPLADGGRGTVDIILAGFTGRRIRLKVKGPLGGKTFASYGIIERGKTAIIEMSSASGIELVSRRRRNPLKTTTYGTGQLIKDALQRGCRKIIVGLGDSATVDGGAGMAAALGAGFLDSRGKNIGFGGGELSRIKKLDTTKMNGRIHGVEFVAACDVKNTLLGRCGAARVYGPQKGATPKMVKALERGLANLARVIKKDTGFDIARIPGGGAAGGLGAGLAAFLNAEIKLGFEIVADFLNLEKRIAACDIVITGEGRVDSQTFCGKTVAGVLKIAKKYDKPVICIAGALPHVNSFGMLRGKPSGGKTCTGGVAFFSVVPRPVSLKEALAEAAENIFETALNIGRLLKGSGLVCPPCRDI